MNCPICDQPMRRWSAPGVSAEVYVCDTLLCDVVKVTVTRSGLGK